MTLHAVLGVNGHDIGRSITIQCLDKDRPWPVEDDRVSTYEWTLIEERTSGTVEHRYGDGPWVLLHKALSVALGVGDA